MSTIKAKYSLVPRAENAAALPVLTDFDWNALVTVASSTMSQMRKPVLQLSLTMSNGTSSVVELDQAQLKNMIAALDDACDRLDSVLPPNA